MLVTQLLMQMCGWRSMPNLFGKGKVQEITWEAKVIRKDGTVEDLGVIAYYNRNPCKRLLNWCHGKYLRRKNS